MWRTNLKNKDQTIKLSGWINKKRDHGNLLFLDLRDHYGLTQCVIDENKKIFKRDDVNFEIFKKLVSKGSIVRGIVTKNTSQKPRSFFDGIDKWAKDEGSSGLAYFSIENSEKLR